MHDLVVSPLQESGVDGTERRHSFAGETSSESHSMLLCNAHIKSAAVKPLLEAVHAGAAAHSSVYTDDAAVPLGLSYQSVSKEVGVGCNLHRQQQERASERKSCVREFWG